MLLFTLDLKFGIKTYKKKVDSIKNAIWQAGLRNNNISVTLNAFSNDDTKEFLNQSIDMATKVSDQMREVRRGASDISSDVYKLKLKLASLEPQWAVKLGLAEENGKSNTLRSKGKKIININKNHFSFSIDAKYKGC